MAVLSEAVDVNNDVFGELVAILECQFGSLVGKLENNTVVDLVENLIGRV